MKRYLFICDTYFYNPSPNGICIQKIAEKNNKSNVTVLTFYNGNNQLEYEKINNVNVYRVNPGIIESVIYKCKDGKNFFQRLAYKFILKISRINGLIHALEYPLLSRKQIRNLYKCYLKLSKKNEFDMVICVYHKIADVLAGIKIKNKNNKIKLILYTLDAISGGCIPSIIHSKKIPYKCLKRWEKLFFEKVDNVFAMESHRNYYNNCNDYKKYLNKFTFLDIPLFEYHTKIENTNTVIKMSYTGSMSQLTANPEYLLKILDKLNNCEFFIYGNISSEIETLIKSNYLYNKRIFICGSKSHEEILEIQKNSNILLNFGNSNPNMIPCKIFEYMSTNNKIISFTHSDLDSSLYYMKKYPNSLIINEDNSKINSNITLINEFLNSKLMLVEKENIETIFEKNRPEYFWECINEQ